MARLSKEAKLIRDMGRVVADVTPDIAGPDFVFPNSSNVEDFARKDRVATLPGSSVALIDGEVFVGDASNVAVSVAMTGDITISNTGVTSIGALKVTSGMLAGNAVDSAAMGIITTKGDVLGYSSVPARVAVGADDAVLTADSAETLGVKWSAPVNATERLGNSVKFTTASTTYVEAVSFEIPAGAVDSSDLLLLVVKWRGVGATTAAVKTEIDDDTTQITMTDLGTAGQDPGDTIYIYFRQSAESGDSQDAYVQGYYHHITTSTLASAGHSGNMASNNWIEGAFDVNVYIKASAGATVVMQDAQLFRFKSGT